MTATRVDIEGWLKKFYEHDEYTHMIVGLDPFDYQNFPVYVKKDEDVRDRANELTDSGNRYDEVYSKTYSFEHQMAEHRAYHWD